MHHPITTRGLILQIDHSSCTRKRNAIHCHFYPETNTNDYKLVILDETHGHWGCLHNCMKTQHTEELKIPTHTQHTLKELQHDLCLHDLQKDSIY